MVYIIKLLLIIILFLVIYVWNKFAPKFVVKSLANSLRYINNKKEPTKFDLDFENGVILLFQLFYWVGFILFAYAIITNDISHLLK